MRKTIIYSIIAITGVYVAPLFSQGDTSKVEGTLVLDKKTYPLKHALAYETTIDDEDAIAVVLSGPSVSSEQLNAARKAEKEGGDPDFKRPFLRLVFKRTGEIKHWGAAAGGTMIGRRSGTATGELKQQNGRVTGKAAVSDDAQGMFPSRFDVRFDTALLKAADSLPASIIKRGGPAANVKPSVSGVFRGNGKDAKLAYVSAQWREPFNDKTAIMLVFTEKDHSKDNKPDMGAMFGKYGSALIISTDEDGGIFGCQVVHSAHKKQGFSSIGNIEMTDFTYAEGKVEGELTTHGELDTFGEKWEVNVKFVAPLGETPKEFQVAEKPKKEEKAANDEDEDADITESGDSTSKPAADGLGAKELALTKDATDVQYQELVEHVTFKSKSDVKKVCAELTANLKAQGWANDGSDMVNAQSSILKRRRGEASLTIFVKPENGGSDVKIFTEGLSW